MESLAVAPKSKGKGAPLPPQQIGTKGKGYGKAPLPNATNPSHGQRTCEDLASALSKVKLKAVPQPSEQAAQTTPTCEMQSEFFEYQHKFRKMEYRSERLEMSSSEREAITKLIAAASNSSSRSPPPVCSGPRRRRILIDTDIGTDADDVLAILTVMGMPEEDVEVLGITTCYHPTLLRKKVAEKLLNAAGGSWPQVRVCAGSTHVCGSHRPIFLKGNEGEGLELTEKEFVAGWQITDGEDAIESMYQAVKKHPGEVAIVAIGMSTNIALCARKHPDFESLVGHIWLMIGGSPVCQKVLSRPNWYGEDGVSASEFAPFAFPKDRDEGLAWLHEGRPVTLFPNHNSSGDSLATSIVLTLRCPVSVIPHWITEQHYLEGPSLEGLLVLGAPGDWVGKQEWLQSASERYHEVKGKTLVRTVGRLFYEWISRRDGQQGQCMHDPLTLYEAVYDQREIAADQVAGDSCSQAISAGGVPSLVYTSGTFVGHEWAGFLTFVPDPTGPHRIALRTLDARAWLSWSERTLSSHLP